MKKRFLLAIIIAIGVLVFGGMTVSAAQSGNLIYEISNGEVTITDCDASASGAIVIPETIEGYPVTSIGEYAFFNCRSLTTIVIPYSVTSIEAYAFYNCTGLTSIIIPDGVTSIGSYAFNGCTGLTSIEIPGSVTSIGNSAFNNCTGLTNVYINDIGAWCNIQFTYYSNPLYYAKNLYFNGKLVTELVIPEGVVNIGDKAFYGCECLTSIEIPDSVKTIGSSAFAGCTSLTNIIVDENNTAYSSENGLLLNKDRTTLLVCPRGLTNVTIPDSVTNIGDSAFYECTGLTSIEIPDSVTSIGNSAFKNCTGLISIEIPDSVTSIGRSAFDECTGLTSVTIGNGVTSIGDGAFLLCTSLTSIEIPDSVTSIGDYAFSYCDGLTSVTIGNGVTSIGNYAFYDCQSLSDVYYTGTEEEWNKIERGTYNDPLFNATIHFNYGQELPVEYIINSITVKDVSGNELDVIPTGRFYATISFTNVSSGPDTVISFAQYTNDGTLKGLFYVSTEGVNPGATLKYTIPMDNTDGKITQLKALCWTDFVSMTPLGKAVVFPNK